MELEELKNNWTILNQRLSANEILNKRIVKEMIVQRAETSLGKLRKFENQMAVSVLFVMAFIGYMSPRLPLTTFTFVIVIAFLLANAAWCVYKSLYLGRIEVTSMTLYNLQKSVLNYRRFVFWERMSAAPSVVLIFGIVVLCNKSAQNALAITVFAVCAFILTPLLAYIEYRLVYAKHLQELEKSMEELKEFDDSL